MKSYIDEKNYRYILQPHSFAAMVALSRMTRGFKVNELPFYIRLSDPVTKTYSVGIENSHIRFGNVPFDSFRFQVVGYSCYLKVEANTRQLRFVRDEDDKDLIRLVIPDSGITIVFDHPHASSREKFEITKSQIDGVFVSENSEKPAVKYRGDITDYNLRLEETTQTNVSSKSTTYAAAFSG